MKFLLNMNMPRSLAKRLQDKGYLCRHAGDIGLSYAEDWEIIEEARRQGEIILTHDLDYGRLLAFTRQSSPSIIIGSSLPMIGDLGYNAGRGNPRGRESHGS
jgi:predicted nuclease of predicted toxin-antitoxin system